MNFKSLIADDMGRIFMNTDEFAEPILYVPKCGAPVTIAAVIDRSQANTRPEDRGRVLHRSAEIMISNHPEDGVAQIDDKGDKVLFAPHPGHDAVEWDVMRILESSPEHWRLEVER
jgi:uncharacterized phosphosugar-binding protein